jgi:ABC-type lipoprotein release transport system permease subunit
MISGPLRLAVRDLGRNARRTALAAVGIGVGCAIALTVVGFYGSMTEAYSRLAAEAGPGHLRVSPAGWLPQRDEALRLVEGERALEAVRAVPGVRLVAPRVRVQALLAMGTRVASVELVGVDSAAEPQALRAARTVVAGRYLAAGDVDAIILGRALAERLGVEPEDDLVVTVMRADGELSSEMLRIAGLITSGSSELDAAIAHAPLPVVQRLSGRGGLAELAVMLDDFAALEARRPQVAAVAGSNMVLRWSEVSADLAGHLRQDQAMSRLLSYVILVVVLLGVAGAQLSAVLERRREFAVFAALGMHPWRLVLQILLEAVLLALLGAATGAALATPGLWYLVTHGLDLRGLMTGELTFEGVLMDPVMYARVGWWMVPYLVRLALTATLLGAVLPAVFVARIDPATALRSAT